MLTNLQSFSLYQRLGVKPNCLKWYLLSKRATYQNLHLGAKLCWLKQYFQYKRATFFKLIWISKIIRVNQQNLLLQTVPILEKLCKMEFVNALMAKVCKMVLVKQLKVNLMNLIIAMISIKRKNDWSFLRLKNNLKNLYQCWK